MTTRRFTNNAHVAAMLDGVATLPCVFCAGDCPVPDYVLAVIDRNGKREPIALCQTCSDVLLEVIPLFRAGLGLPT